MRRIEVAELSLTTLDALDVEAMALLVGEERPLQGLPGLVDWRLAGALTRTITDGHYAAGPGEALLLPTLGRIPATRVVAVGWSTEQAGATFAAAVERLCQVVTRAGAASFAAAALPAPGVPGVNGAEACRAWLQAAAAVPGHRLVLLGDPRSLAADLGVARFEARSEIEVAPFSAPPAAMVR
jgi:hypothetical protein